MPAFTKLDWTRFDVWALVATEGIVVVDRVQQDPCQAWLHRNDYGVVSVDFGQGIGPAVERMGNVLRWQEQFGYTLTAESRNLDALRDGFEFELEPGQGKVLTIHNADVAQAEDESWLMGLLSIAHEYSRCQLALGVRFFTVLFLSQKSRLIGKAYESLVVPPTYSTPARGANPFMQ